MLPQSHYMSHKEFLSPPVCSQSQNTNTKVFFTYHSSPVGSPQQSLKVIKELNESIKKKRIFQPRRKLSFRSIDSTNKPKSRLRIFDPPMPKRIPTLNSHIFLKDSIISNAQTIVDQLQQLEQSQSLKNPITKKLQCMKHNNRDTKRTFYSNTVKNSIMLNELPSVEGRNERQSIGSFHRRNRIDSEVLNYNYCPGNMTKNYSSVTIKASKDNRLYGGSKFSNGLSIITNNPNDNNNYMFSTFKDTQNVQTPKYHRSTYKSMRKSFDPGFVGDLQRRQKQLVYNETKKQSISPSAEASYPHTDRFYDESSLETPRLPTVSKKISYEVIDPLTNSLRKQKLEKKQYLRKLSEEQQALKNALPKKQSKMSNLFTVILASILQVLCSTKSRVSNGTRSCVNFTRSEVFVIIIIVMLSLTIFMIQLVQ